MESELSIRSALSELPDGRKYLLQCLPCSQFSLLGRTEPVLSHSSCYIWRAARTAIRENTLTFIRYSQSPEPEATNFTSILIKFTSCTWRQPRTRLCLGPLWGLLVQWHRGEADEKFLSRRSQWGFSSLHQVVTIFLLCWSQITVLVALKHSIWYKEIEGTVPHWGIRSDLCPKILTSFA